MSGHLEVTISTRPPPRAHVEDADDEDEEEISRGKVSQSEGEEHEETRKHDIESYEQYEEVHEDGRFDDTEQDSSGDTEYELVINRLLQESRQVAEQKNADEDAKFKKILKQSSKIHKKWAREQEATDLQRALKEGLDADGEGFGYDDVDLECALKESREEAKKQEIQYVMSALRENKAIALQQFEKNTQDAMEESKKELERRIASSPDVGQLALIHGMAGNMCELSIGQSGTRPESPTTAARRKPKPAVKAAEAQVDTPKPAQERTTPKQSQAPADESRAGDENRKCFVCHQSFPTSETTQLKCNHAWCHGCMIERFEELEKDPQPPHFPPQCCNRKIGLSVIKPLVDDDANMRYKQKDISVLEANH